MEIDIEKGRDTERETERMGGRGDKEREREINESDFRTDSPSLAVKI